MKRFLIRMAIAGIVVLFMGAKFVDISAGQTLETDPLLRAWGATAVSAQEFVVDGWGLNNRTFLPLAEVDRLGRQFSKQLGISDSAPTLGEEPSFRYFTLHGQMNDGTHTIITVQSMQGHDQPATHVGILLAGKGDAGRLPHLRRQVLALLADGGEPGEASAAVSGFASGRMDEETARALCSRVTAAVRGKRVGYHKDETGITLSLYSAELGATVDFGGEKINLQLAVRYDAALRQTQVTVASPMITEFS